MSSGNVYVADTYNHRIQKFDSSGNFLLKWGSPRIINGIHLGSAGDGQFNNPYGVAVDDSGNVYVSDSSNQRVQKFDSSGNFITKWGSFGTEDGQLKLPNGVAVDNSGNVYVTDMKNNRVQKFTSGE